ncbi:MAG TPA: hypothetical protein VGK26_12735 [Thermoanaerobaculia bacterium]
MRRLSCAFAALLLIAPAGLRLALADSDAVRLCAIACGHAMKAGAACCPMGEAGLTISPCTPDDSSAAAPVPASQPAILMAIQSLVAPEPGASAFTFSSAAPRAPAARPPDHVPIVLS